MMIGSLLFLSAFDWLTIGSRGATVGPQNNPLKNDFIKVIHDDSTGKTTILIFKGNEVESDIQILRTVGRTRRRIMASSHKHLRIRDLGYSPGQLPTGPKNSILDVPGTSCLIRLLLYHVLI
jgi:hypothetical protein